MTRDIATAYGIAGLSAAIAVVAVVGSTVGFFDPPAASDRVPLAQVAETPPTPTPTAQASAPSAEAADVQYVDEQGRPVAAPSQRERRFREADERGEERWEGEEEGEEEEEEEEEREHHGRGHRRGGDDD